MSTSNKEFTSNEKRIRFRPSPKVLHHSESEIDDYPRSDKGDADEGDNCSKKGKNSSLFTFLTAEITRDYLLEHDEERYSANRERVYSFMKIPREVERFMRYGFLQCTDSFLFVYTFLPLRVGATLWTLFCRPFSTCFRSYYLSNKKCLTPAKTCDLLKAVILIVCSMLMCWVDTNMLYHLIKSQSVIKLYIFYNMLEVGDRLFAAFGQDIIDALFWTATEPRGRKREHLGVIPHLAFAIVYVVLHSILVLLQATTLNVSINSNNKVLLTILMSNNFVELKGSVFKKFDKNNLFQVTCSDVRERFHLIVLLFIVGLQTMKEYSWKFERFLVLLPDFVIVLVVEMFIDWIKHAFITRFNDLQWDVYRDYSTSLAYDVAQSRQKHAFSDHSDLVARRMGFIPLPLGVVMIRVLISVISIEDIPSVIICFVIFICLVSLKILNSIVILGKACELITQHKQEKAAASSPTYNRANSPLTVGFKTKTPTKEVSGGAFQVLGVPTDNRIEANGFGPIDVVRRVEDIKDDPQAPPSDLGPAAIFANSTVDLKNATLNEELLKGESEEEIDLEGEIMTRSFPDIKGEFDEEEIKEKEVLKRAESEPSLNTTCTEDDEIPK